MTELSRRGERSPVPKDWTYAPAPESRELVKLRERYGLFVGGEWLEPAGPAPCMPVQRIGRAQEPAP